MNAEHVPAGRSDSMSDRTRGGMTGSHDECAARPRSPERDAKGARGLIVRFFFCVGPDLIFVAE